VTATLYSYWRSTAAYRVRIALNLKGVAYVTERVDLTPGVDAQRDPAYAAKNPQRLVPYFVDDRIESAQSMAILEYLEERYSKPSLLSGDAQRRADIRSVCQHIACDVHPLNNVGVLTYLRKDMQADAEAVSRWYANWVYRVFDSIEPLVERHGGPFVFGDTLTLADVLLVPQMYNAHRFEVPIEQYPSLLAVEAHCLTIDAFGRARPENQPDAP